SEYQISRLVLPPGSQEAVPSLVANVVLPFTDGAPSTSACAPAHESLAGGLASARLRVIAPPAEAPFDATRTLYVVLGVSVSVTAERGPGHGTPGASSLQPSSVSEPQVPL